MKQGKIRFKEENEEKTFQYEPNESSFWEAVARNLLECSIPNTLYVEAEEGCCEIQVKERGSFIQNGKEKPSMYVTVTRNTIDFHTWYHYENKYLVCVNPESNNYKGYSLTQLPDGSIDCVYGSLDAMVAGRGKHVSQPYKSYLYWIRYFEKLSKGYMDKSDIYLDDTETKSEIQTEKKDENASLWERLAGYAQKMKRKYLVSQKITPKQVAESRKIWGELGKYKSVSWFNKKLKELIAISPRKRDPLSDNINRYFATNENDFSRIIDFEESLIMSMEAGIGKNVISGRFNDIEVFKANDKQTEEVMKLLGDSPLKNKVVNVWRVKPKKQEKLFGEYCRKNGIKTIKKLWHGSRSENWASIIANSLSLNPNAVITGKMFGKGIYFAPSPTKSFNYTSCRGTYWARGTENSGFMGIYATAYGNPYMARTSGDHNRIVDGKQYNCLHATPANTGLRNDEIVFYSEQAVCLNYLVEFSN